MKKISLSLRRLLSLTIAFCLIITTVGPITAFAEDLSGHWAIDDINFMREKGLVQGDLYGNINPSNNITRADLITFINRAFEFSEVGETNFPDVKPGSWYYDDFAIAKKQGYILGDDKGNANPSNPITRAEIAVVLARILDLKPQSDAVNTFADSASFPDWSVNSIIAMAESGLIGGYSDKTFRASNSITRAEVITIMARIIDINGDARTITSFDTVIVFTSINTAPIIPNKIPAYYGYGSSGSVSVIWDAIDASQYASAGTFTIQGSVAGTSIRPNATVTVSPNAPVTFADSNFKTAVVYNLKQLPGYSHYTKDSDLYPEILAILTDLNVDHREITSIGELFYFTNLESLSCDNNNLTVLDVSKNPTLRHLSCFNNDLTALDVSKNPALQHLDCGENNLSILDVSNNLALLELYCYENNLTTLDISANLALVKLSCTVNNLSELDVSNNLVLEGLYCGYTNLTALDVSANTALEGLACWGNNLTALDVSANKALDYLDCSGTNLTTLDISVNTALKSLSCRGINITTLDISNNKALEMLYCNYNNLSILDVSNNPALKDLFCNDNNLTALDVSHNPALIDLSCNDNNLTTLDVSHNPALQKLDCSNNNLTTLDVSNNKELTELYCSNNHLTTVDLNNNTWLWCFSCDSNNLTTVDLSKQELLRLKCGGPQLHSVYFARGSNICSIDINGDGCLSDLSIDFYDEQIQVEVLGENVPSWVLSGTTIASSVAELDLTLTDSGMAYSEVTGTKLVANF